MKFNKPTLVASAFAAAIAAGSLVPVFAVEESTQESPVYGIDVRKTVTTDGKTYAPNMKFHFVAKGVEPTESAANQLEINYSTFKKGIDGSVVIPDAEFTPYHGEENKFEKPGSAYTVENKILVYESMFDAPGVYAYEVYETNEGSNELNAEGITYSDKKYELFVTVVEKDGKYEVESYTARDVNFLEKTAELEFVNDYGKENGKIHSAKVTKLVDGNFRNKNEKFTFTASVTSKAAREENYYYEILNADGTVREDGALVYENSESASAAEFVLGHEESVVIYGLSESDTFTVSEANVTIKDGTYTTDTGYEVTVEDETSTTGFKNGNTVEGTTAGGNVDKVVKNTRDSITPTGIVTMYGPYAVLTGFAAAFGAFFFKRKKDQEFE